MDAGECTRSAPCASFAYALPKVSATRRIVRVTGGDLGTATSSITLGSSVIIDSDGTRFFAPASTPMFAVASGKNVTIEGITLTGSASSASITVGAGASLRLREVTLNHADVTATNAAVDASKLKVNASAISCTSGALSVSESTFESGTVSFSSCQTTVARNRWDPGFDASVTGMGGLLKVENNVFVVPSEFADLIQVRSLVPGSAFAFNTVVNTSSVMQSPVAISCDSTLKVSSNIIAYHSTNPIDGDGCVARSSLLDALGAADAPGNASGDVATFFQNRAAGDFHLAPDSPARGLGEPNLVSVDLDGRPRPAPTGSLPDVGAFESP